MNGGVNNPEEYKWTRIPETNEHYRSKFPDNTEYYLMRNSGYQLNTKDMVGLSQFSGEHGNVNGSPTLTMNHNFKSRDPNTLNWNGAYLEGKFNISYKKNSLEFLADDNRSKLGEPLIENYHREDSLSFMKLIEISLKLGFTTFGGPLAHQEIIFIWFCKENGFLTPRHFRKILTLCLFLPGYSSSTLLAAICGIKRRSMLEGFLALILFNIPSLFAVILFTVILKITRSQIQGLIVNYHEDIILSNESNPIVFFLMTLSTGIIQAALGLMIQTGYLLSMRHSNSKFQILLLVLSGVAYYLVPNYIISVIIIISCGIISSLKGDHDYLLNRFEIISFDENIASIKMIGIPCLVIFKGIFIISSVLNFFYPSFYLFLFESLYRIGALSFGEGHAIIPMILSEYTEKNLLSETDVLNGYALVSLLPGSLFNIASFTGVICLNIIGGLIANIAIFLPGFLFVYATLPYIDKLKSSNFFQFFFRGANSATIGFLFAAAVKLWFDCCITNQYTDDICGTINVLICFLLCEVFKLHKPFIIIFGAFFIVAINYMKLQLYECPINPASSYE